LCQVFIILPLASAGTLAGMVSVFGLGAAASRQSSP
jgi:hypothetical protein